MLLLKKKNKNIKLLEKKKYIQFLITYFYGVCRCYITKKSLLQVASSYC